MNENVNVTLNGQPALSARVELRRGSEASTCEVVLPPGAAPAVGDALELTLRDATTQRTLRQFVCTHADRLADGRAVIYCADRRYSWRGRIGVLPQVEAGRLDDALQRLFRSAGFAVAEAPADAASLPSLPAMRGPLGALVEQLCALAGFSIGVDDAGEFVLSPPHARPHAGANLIESRTGAAGSGEITIIGAPPLQLRAIAEWEPVVPVQGEWQPLAQVLQQWGIAEGRARQACLGEGGFAALIGEAGPEGVERAAVLSRYAFRAFRGIDTPLRWVPVGGVAADGALLPPRLETRASRPISRAPAHPADAMFAHAGFARAIEGFEIDLEHGVVILDEPPYLLAAGAAGDPTRQSQTLAGGPQLRLTVAHDAEGEAYRFTLHGNGDPARVISAPHLVPVLDEAGDATNRHALDTQAQALAASIVDSPARSVSRYAGVAGDAIGAVQSVVIRADAGGLTSEVIESPLPGPAFAPLPQPAAHALEPVRPSAPQHQPINAWRAGPLVLRTSDRVD
jgi:hypothetical protein